MDNLRKCNMCPHKCLVDRENNKQGFCNAGSKIKIALADVFHYEEPCISGENGSGTIFFSNCNLRCVYCQNYEISSGGKGKEITVQELADIFLGLQERNVNNINLVTPTIYTLQIKEAIILAKKRGLNLPIIYNSSGYENIDTLRKLEGCIDIYLPDFKYASDDIAFKYSGIKNYVEIATNAILEMYRQVGNVQIDNDGIIKKGLIIRNLILPNNVRNTKKVLEWISNNIGKDVYVSIMAQYFPTNRSNEFSEINRKITKREFKIIERYLFDLGFNNGYIQSLGECEEKYVPKFDLNEK